MNNNTLTKVQEASVSKGMAISLSQDTVMSQDAHNLPML